MSKNGIEDEIQSFMEKVEKFEIEKAERLRRNRKKVGDKMVTHVRRSRGGADG